MNHTDMAKGTVMQATCTMAIGAMATMAMRGMANHMEAAMDATLTAATTAKVMFMTATVAEDTAMDTTGMARDMEAAMVVMAAMVVTVATESF